jgi:hypothetical protein
MVFSIVGILLTIIGDLLVDTQATFETVAFETTLLAHSCSTLSVPCMQASSPFISP